METAFLGTNMVTLLSEVTVSGDSLEPVVNSCVLVISRAICFFGLQSQSDSYLTGVDRRGAALNKVEKLDLFDPLRNRDEVHINESLRQRKSPVDIVYTCTLTTFLHNDLWKRMWSSS